MSGRKSGPQWCGACGEEGHSRRICSRPVTPAGIDRGAITLPVAEELEARRRLFAGARRGDAAAIAALAERYHCSLIVPA